jgi:hypothetical protein
MSLLYFFENKEIRLERILEPHIEMWKNKDLEAPDIGQEV